MATEITTGSGREISNEYDLDAHIKARIDHVRAKAIPNKEIFLRELILNASAALDKYRYESLTEKPTRREFPELAILIEVNKSDRTISITDSGIGFSECELLLLFGDMINPRAQPIHDAWMIDVMVEQLSIGFYSVFAVADKVVIITKYAEDVGLSWILSSKGKYMVNKDPSFPLLHGNKVIIYLRKDASNYMKKETIMDIIYKYVSFLEYPIQYIDGGMIAPNTEQIPTLYYGGALWKRKLTESCYQKLYKFLSRDTENCLTFKVMKGGESFTFTAVLFVPRREPSDFFMQANPDKKILLYLNGVRVTDEYEELLPDDLRFIRGIVNVDDLFFSISQKEALSKVILSNVRDCLLQKVLKWFAELSVNKEVFPIFYEQYGRNLKLDVYKDRKELICFRTSATPYKLHSLNEIYENMNSNQEFNYCMTAEVKGEDEDSNADSYGIAELFNEENHSLGSGSNDEDGTGYGDNKGQGQKFKKDDVAAVNNGNFLQKTSVIS